MGFGLGGEAHSIRFGVPSQRKNVCCNFGPGEIESAHSETNDYCVVCECWSSGFSFAPAICSAGYREAQIDRGTQMLLFSDATQLVIQCAAKISRKDLT